MSGERVAWRALVALARAAAYTVSGWLVLAVVDGWVGLRGGRDVELPAWLYWLTPAGAGLVAAYNERARWRMKHPRHRLDVRRKGRDPA